MSITLDQLTANPLWFPPPEQALVQPDGLLAFGGDLSVARLHAAYRCGIFPWFSEGDPLLWWSPSTRAVFKPDTLSANRSLRKYARKQGYHYSCNRAFQQVITQCAATRLRQGTWITAQIRHAYHALHQAGLAHSIEVWRGEQLVGGLYGVQVGQLFCGESMFNLEPNCAKLALVLLQQQLTEHGCGWIDCQMPNPFLLQCGASPLPRTAFLALLSQLRDKPLPSTLWESKTLESRW